MRSNNCRLKKWSDISVHTELSLLLFGHFLCKICHKSFLVIKNSLITYTWCNLYDAQIRPYKVSNTKSQRLENLTIWESFIVNPFFDGITYNISWHFAHISLARIFYVNPLKKVYLFSYLLRSFLIIIYRVGVNCL